MKILVILVLVFLTGCNGGRYGRPSKHQTAMAQDAYWDYVQKSTMTPEDNVWDIRHSHQGQYLCSLIAESFQIISNFLHNVYTHMVWWIMDFYSRFCHEVDHLQHDLDYFLHYLEAETHSHAKELADQIRWRLEDIKKCAAHYAEALDPRGLKVALVQKIQDLHHQVENYFVHRRHRPHGGHNCGHKGPHDYKGHHDHHHRRHYLHNLWYKQFWRHHHDRRHYRDHQHYPNMKKKVYDSLHKFRVTLFSLVVRFEVKLTQTTYELNKKIVPLRRRREKLNKASDGLQDVLAYLWEVWAQSQKKVV